MNYKELIEKSKKREKEILKNSSIKTKTDRYTKREEIYKLFGFIVEDHHIKPFCMGGLDVFSNMVFLTPREHFLAHKLLAEQNINSRTDIKEKLFHAYNIISNNGTLSEKEYQKAKEDIKKSGCLSSAGKRSSEINKKLDVIKREKGLPTRFDLMMKSRKLNNKMKKIKGLPTSQDLTAISVYNSKLEKDPWLKNKAVLKDSIGNIKFKGELIKISEFLFGKNYRFSRKDRLKRYIKQSILKGPFKGYKIELI